MKRSGFIVLAVAMILFVSAIPIAIHSQPSSSKSPTTTITQQIDYLKARIAALKAEREKLLFLYRPGDDKVKRVDLQIIKAQRQLERAKQRRFRFHYV